MNNIDKQLSHIYTRSLNLNERVKLPNLFNGKSAPADISVQLRDWKKFAFDNNEALFNERLKRLNLSSNELHNYFGKVEFRPNIEYPNWINFLKDIISQFPGDENSLPIYKERLVPFQEIYTPIIKTISSKIREKLKEQKVTPNDNALHDIELSLYNYCKNNFGQTIYLEYRIFKTQYNNPFLQFAGGKKEYTSDEIYKLFISQFTRSNLLMIFTEYPLLARHISVSFKNIIENLIEGIDRLNKDIDELKNIFEVDSDQITINRLDPTLSDFHNNGRSVISFELNTGHKIIYKPRSLDTDKLYYDILTYLEDKQVIGSQFKPKMLIKHNYGWIEKIEQESCTSESEIREYYTNMGSLLSIIYLLGGNDFHFENVIAKKTQPVLIDLESIIHPPYINLSIDEYNDGLEKLQRDIQFSVLRSGIIPNWGTYRGNMNVDISALGFYEPQETPYDVPNYTNEGTDSVGIEYKKYKITERFNVAYLNEEKIPPYHFINEIKEGFEKVYNFFMTNDVAKVLSIIKSNKIRYIYRSTNDYGFIQRQLLNPKFLKDGVYQTFLIDRLFPNSDFVDKENYEIYLQVFESEQEQLTNFDVPYFFMMTDGKDFFTNESENLPNIVKKTAVEMISDKLDKLSKADLNLQLNIISKGLKYREFGRAFQYKYESTQTELNNSEIEKEIIRIGDKLLDDAIYGPNDTVNWLVADFGKDQMKPITSPNNLILYNGLSGIGIFFSAMFYHFKDERYRIVSENILNQFESILNNSRHAYTYQSIPNGVGVGIGSIIYSLLTMSEFLDSPKALELAEKYSATITDERIAQDKVYDLLAGNAGLILSFEKLYLHTNNEKYLQMAKKCVDYLLNAAQTIDGLKVIPTVEGKMLTGFSHGSAGIAYALLRINRYLKNDEIDFIANEHLKFERKHFSDSEKNWPDFREEISEMKFGFMTAWCHGSSGIGYSRLVLSKFYDDKILIDEINSAVHNSMNYKVIESDHVCCGNFSVIEFLLEAGRTLDKHDMEKEARQRASQLIGMAQKYNDYIYFSQSSMRLMNPAFFQGISGIGYSLLKMVNPKLKSVVMFE